MTNRENYKHWSNKEISFLVDSRIHGISMQAIAAVLDRELQACYSRAQKPDCTIRIMKGQSDIFKEIRGAYENELKDN